MAPDSDGREGVASVHWAIERVIDANAAFDLVELLGAEVRGLPGVVLGRPPARAISESAMRSSACVALSRPMT